MSTVQARYQNGQVVLESPVNWDDGTKLRVEPVIEPVDVEFVGMSEEEQGDDPESIARWIEAVEAIPSLEMSEEEERGLKAWREQMKAYNVEAVRKQMEELGP